MPLSLKSNPLTLSERQALGAMFEHAELMSAITKVLDAHVASWRQSGRNEALADDPNTNKMIQYAAREDEVGKVLQHLREAAQR